MQRVAAKEASLFSLTLVLFLFLIFPGRADAQLGGFGSMIQGGVEDGEILANEYLRPFGSGFGANLNTGWTNTAPVHGTLGFSVNVRTGIAVVPDIDQSFDVAALDFNNLRLAEPAATAPTPTLAGASESGPLMEAFLTADLPDGSTYDYVIDEFNMPQGTGFEYVPTPMVQANVGIIRNTEIAIRYLPPVLPSVGGFEMELYGGGIKHELNQYIPGGGLWPVTFTVMGGFTQMGASYDGFTLTPDDYQQADPENPYPDSEWEDQALSLTTTAWNANLLVGRNLPLISFYAGLGIESSNMQILTEGNYPLLEPDPTIDNPEQTRVNSVEEPLNIDIDGKNELRALAGVRLRFFGVLHFTAEYTYADYQVLNVGLGVGIR